MDLELRNNALGQGVLARFIPAHEVLKVPTFGGYFLEFSVSEFSEFYISTGDLGGNEGVLPLQLISFQAKATVNGQHELNWETASERNLDRFELQYSRDGQQYQTISTRKPEAPENGGSRYQFNWKPDPSAQAFYRLLVFDKGLVTPVLQEIRVLKNELSSIWMSNPVTSEIRLQGIPEAGVRLKLTDLSGRLLFEGQSQGQSYVIPVTGLASGTYQLQVIQDFISHTYRVLKP